MSAKWLVGHYVEPNAAPWLGRWLAMSGRLELNDWRRLKGTTVAGDPALRAFELPGEPLWVAAGTRVGKSIGVDVWDYWNVPVAALLITSIAAVALALYGPTVALITGLVAALDPVTVLHASNRDDAVLGSALLWAVFALMALRWRDAPRRHVASGLTLLAAAGAAAITRTEAVLMIVPLLALKPIRRAAAVAVAGVVVALSAWGARNQMVLGHFLVGSTHDGITLWESNGPFALRSLSLGQVDIVSMNKTVMAPIFAQTHDLDEIGADKYFKAQAVHYMITHPIQVAKTSAAKIAVSIASVHPDQPLTTPRNLAAMLDNAVLFVLAALSLRGFPAKTALAGMCLITLALLAFGPAGMRYWLTLRGALWILAASTLVRLIPRTLSSSAPAPQ